MGFLSSGKTTADRFFKMYIYAKFMHKTRRMDTKTALKVLGITAPTYRRYRRMLGIFEETSFEISETNVDKIKRLIESQGNSKDHREKVITEMKAIEERNTRDVLTIKPFDSAQVVKLKEHYNTYTRYLDYLTKVIEDCMQEGSLPPRDTSNMIEKFETLCIKIAKELRHLEGDTDGVAEVINDRLQRYTS